MKRTGAEIRRAFLDYFSSKGHEVVSSSSLVPQNDPTILFSNAGMNQFKDCFLGSEKRSYTRATSSQKCLRISGKHNDLENVGVTARHHTFFEMLGNFSFGDYFKKEAIQFAWEFVTEILLLNKDRLWVTVFKDDDEAAGLWAKETDVKKDRILRFGEKDNFWAMGDTGPCGPCSEIFYYIGESPQAQSEEELRKDDGTYVEIWNLVFMQFDRQESGKKLPLPKPSIDTGAGLERIAAVVQGVKSNYDSDLLRDIIAEVERLSGVKYDGSSYEARDLKTDRGYARDVAMRVIADHARAASFLIADGVTPGSDGRGYVLRRIIRRAVRHGRVLEFSGPFMAGVSRKVVSMMGESYPELKEHSDLIEKLIKAEETKFHETLDVGLKVLHDEREKLLNGKLFPGQTAFLLHDTYGFPLDLTEDVLKAYGIKVDRNAFQKSMAAQKQRSRDDRKQKNLSFVSVKVDAEASEFLGYNTLEAESEIIAVPTAQDGKGDHFSPGSRLSLIVSATPFYAESGGQVGDTGLIDVKGVKLRVHDTQKVQNKYWLHECEVMEGEFSLKLIGEKAHLVVDSGRRAAIRVHHSATHLLHAALRKVLGNHVKQAGSRVDDLSLRFDYSHYEPVSQPDLEAVQSYINEQACLNHEVITREMPVDEAKKLGAMALFGEKYGDVVRVVQIGPKSLELCGGTHVNRSGDIGFGLVVSETGISAGVRRIECVAGKEANRLLLAERAERETIAELLKGDSADLAGKVEKLLERARALEHEVEDFKEKLAGASVDSLLDKVKSSPSGIKVIAERVDSPDLNTLRTMVDQVRVKLRSGVVALGASDGKNALIVAGVTKDLTDSLNAGALVKEAVKEIGGKGGGRADFGQAGGGDPAKLGSALKKFYEMVA